VSNLLIPTCLLMAGCLLTAAQRVQVRLAHSTARSAARWAMTALTVLIVALLTQLLDGPAVYASVLQYLAAVMFLTPLVDVLGARNPGHRAWPWFVVLPLVLVLMWPAVSHAVSESGSVPLEVPAPAFVGFVVVLIMGAGNYFGTAHTSASLWGATGVIVLALPVTEWVAWPSTGWLTAGCFCLSVCGLLVEGRMIILKSDNHQQMWRDFRDIYGFVWAKRVMDRINQFSEREHWNVVMTLEGFRTHDGHDPAEDDLVRPLEVYHWVTQRFHAR